MASCVMCPKSIFGGEWSGEDLELETFRRMEDYFGSARIVWLQGWGEPLLSRDIYEMVRLGSRGGARVGLTTNGILLTEDVAKRLIEQGIGVIAFSIAGSTKEIHEGIRRGTSFNKIIENVRRLTTLRRNVGARDLRIVFTFLRMKQNIHELPGVVELAGELDVDEVVGTNLDYVACEEHERMKIFSEDPPPKEYDEIIRRSEEVAREVGVSLHNYPLRMNEAPICFEKPINSLFVSHDGSVSPCVYLNVPLKGGTIPRVFRGERFLVKRLVFGNVGEEELSEIWEKPDYARFRSIFEERVKRSSPGKTPFEILLGFKVRGNIPPLPDPCRTCYKAYGV